MANKLIYAGLGIILVVLSLVLYFQFFHEQNIKVTNIGENPRITQGSFADAIIFNGEALTDHTQYFPENNTCLAENLGFQIFISPCIQQDVDGKDITQDVNFKWTGAQPLNGSFVFVYSDEIESGKMELRTQQVVAQPYIVFEERWVTNYPVRGVVSYIDLSPPQPNRCQIGSVNNTRMFNVTFSNQTTTYCFTDITPLNSTDYLISGNASLPITYYKNYTFESLVDVTEVIEFMGNDLLGQGMSFYKVAPNVTFEPGEEIKTVWTYTPVNKTLAGKWHIFGYESEYGLVESIIDERYIYVDPWWDSDWSRKKSIDINTTGPYSNIENYTVWINVTWETGMQSDFDDLRFLDPTETTELSYWFYNNSVDADNSAYVAVYIGTLTNQTIWMYFNNDAASDNSNFESSFFFADDFTVSSLNTTKWTQSGGTVSFLNGVMTFAHDGSGNDYLWAQNWILNTTIGAELGMSSNFSRDGADVYSLHGLTQSTAFTSVCGMSADFDLGGKVYVCKNVSGTTKITRTSDYIPWMQKQITINSSSATFFENRVLKAVANGNLTSSGTPYLLVNAAPPAPKISLDWIYMRPVAGTDPNITFGATQQNINIVTLNEPADDTTTISPVVFNCSGYNNVDYVVNITLLLDGADYVTVFNQTASVESLELWQNLTLDDGVYEWNCRMTDGSGLSATGDARTLTIDSNPPEITIYSPTNDSNQYTLNSTSISLVLNYTAIDNPPPSCWYTSSFNPTPTYVVCNVTQTIHLGGIYGLQGITVHSNNSLNVESNETTYFRIHRSIFDMVEYETDSSSLALLLYNLTSVPTSHSLNYSDEIYTSTLTTINSTLGRYDLNVTIDVPATSGNGNFSFNWMWSGQSSSLYNQTLLPIYWTLCNSTIDTQYLNITFKDETTNDYINGSIDESTWEYWFGSGDKTKLYTFSNQTENGGYEFCFTPQNRTVNVDAVVRYSSTGYPVRTFNPIEVAYTNITSTRILYLLGSDVGIYSSIQTALASNAPIEGVYIIVERQINNVWTVVESGTTDSSGLVTFWLNPSFQYRITASKEGYVTTTATIQPSQSVYTLVMARSGEQAAAYNGTLLGMEWIVSPPPGFLNLGTYTFDFNLTASLDNLEQCKFELYDFATNTTLASTVGGEASGCNLSITYTLNQSFDIVGKLYVDTSSTDGFYLIDGDQRWRGFETNVSTWTTFESFIDELKNLPEFGEEPYRQAYSRMIVFFFFLTVLLGLFTFFTGYDIANPGVALVLLLFMMIPFSIAGWFYMPFGGPQTPEFLKTHWLTVWLGMITIGYFLNQWGKY